MRYLKRFESIDGFDPNELKMGLKIEKEHGDVWRRLDSYLESYNVSMPFTEDEFYELIAKSHLKEIPDYYSRLKIMEKGAK